MASRLKDITDERSYGIKRRCNKKLNTRKSAINWVRVFENWCDENGLEENPETVRPEQSDKVLERFLPACVNKTEPTTIVPERNLSPMTLKGNQMVYS